MESNYATSGWPPDRARQHGSMNLLIDRSPWDAAIDSSYGNTWRACTSTAGRAKLADGRTIGSSSAAAGGCPSLMGPGTGKGERRGHERSQLELFDRSRSGGRRSTATCAAGFHFYTAAFREKARKLWAIQQRRSR